MHLCLVATNLLYVSDIVFKVGEILLLALNDTKRKLEQHLYIYHKVF